MRRLAFLGCAIFGLTLFALYGLWPWPLAEGAPALLPRLIAVLALTVLVYFAAVALVSRAPLPKRAIWVVLLIAAAIRLPVLFTPPILSSDIYRYLWDGRVQDAGVNPYLFVPADPALAALRDEAIYPHINRADYAHTIYPPAAQAVFAAVARVAPTLLGWKSAMLGFEVLAIVCLIRLLTLAGLPAARVLIYAWNPLPVWSFACDGHVDAIGIGLLAAALLLRCLKRDGFAGALFGAAILVKLFPVAAGPALWRRGGGWRLVAAGTVTILALYACYIGAGWRVFGFLPGYGAEEGLADGSGIWLLAGLARIFVLPAGSVLIYGAAALLLLAGAGLWIMTRRLPTPGTPADVATVCRHAAVLAAGMTVAISPHYPWYFAWLAMLGTVPAWRSVIWLSAAPVLIYGNPFNAPWLWNALIYVPAAILAVFDLGRANDRSLAARGNTRDPYAAAMPPSPFEGMP